MSNGEAGLAGASGANVLSYAGYTVDEPLECPRRMADAFSEMLKPYAGLKGKVGVEMAQLPAALFVKLQAALPQATLVDLGQQIDPLRAVKTAQEIEKIRAAYAWQTWRSSRSASTSNPGSPSWSSGRW